MATSLARDYVAVREQGQALSGCWRWADHKQYWEAAKGSPLNRSVACPNHSHETLASRPGELELAYAASALNRRPQMKCRLH